MFYHVKELQFNARVTKPDPRFATMLLEQFGGPNGELAAGMQYFTQAFAARMPYPEKYDMLMDIATEEFSHLEIVGATIMMLLDGVNGELKSAAEKSDLMQMLQGSTPRDELIHAVSVNPQFLNLSGGAPRVTDSQGVPFSGAYIQANADLTVDLRSDIAAESRAKIVYEYLLQFTEDPEVRATLNFLMTREIAHFKMFESALATIEPNFPPGILQGDVNYTHKYFNTSNGNSIRGPWNQGQGTWAQGEWNYIEDPIEHVYETAGMRENHGSPGSTLTSERVDELNQQLSHKRSQEIKKATPKYPLQWSDYPQTESR